MFAIQKTNFALICQWEIESQTEIIGNFSSNYVEPTLLDTSILST